MKTISLGGLSVASGIVIHVEAVALAWRCCSGSNPANLSTSATLKAGPPAAAITSAGNGID
jgi:hypothetical protein